MPIFYDDDADDGDQIVPDGARVRVPMMLMDGLQRSVHDAYAMNKPGYRYGTGDAQDAREQAYSNFASVDYRTRDGGEAAQHASDRTSLSVEDAEGAREKAYEAYVESLDYRTAGQRR
jgi:hypothetical protein